MDTAPPTAAEAAVQRASQPGKPEQPAAAPVKISEPRRRDDLLDDLRDRDDPVIDLEDFEDFGDFGDLEDFDDLEDRREDAEEAALDEDDIGLSPIASLDTPTGASRPPVGNPNITGQIECYLNRTDRVLPTVVRPRG